MIEQRKRRASGAARMLGLLALLAGIVAMHAGVFAFPAHGESGGHTGAAMTHHAASATVESAKMPVHQQDCGSDGCAAAHGGIHACVFVLAAFALAIGLVVLARLAVDRPGTGIALPRHWRPRRERPPPWTVLSRAELSILRI
ncbi:DUF6153 family protein [Nocardia arthritidis]|uniref:Uncharacterized protein n=1 Tax=Nocardia arthritidis TaxID=228602 RepID=A0A6G9YRK3_9NOCA|nr:DUF6153 family protein [Nocardia arthritidis]QIS15646.1 hypothetical protein F5544_39125 [Nocardia arthritidis]